MEKLIQVRVDERVKEACDAIFAEDGMTTQQAMKTFLYQVAKAGKSPFENVFSSYTGISSREPLKQVAEDGVIYQTGKEGEV
jgi:DNA-damage-inducible protein J